MYKIITIFIFVEVFAQFAKRSSYIFSSKGDSNLFMLITFTSSLLVSIALIYSACKSVKSSKLLRRLIMSPLPYGLISLLIGLFENGLQAAIMFTQHYYWLFVLVLYIRAWDLERKHHLTINTFEKPLFEYSLFIVFLFSLVIALIQFFTSYALELPWFLHSGTSLSFAGLTNFGTSIRLLGPFSGIIDFSFFVLFATMFFRFKFGFRFISLVTLTAIGSKAVLFSFVLSKIYQHFPFLWSRIFLSGSLIVIPAIFYYIYQNFLDILWSLPVGLLSVSTLAPRLEIWAETLSRTSLFGSMGMNLSSSNVLIPIDSSILFIATDCGILFLCVLIYQLIGLIVSQLKSRNIGLAIFTIVFCLTMLTQVNALMRFTLLLFTFSLSPWGPSNVAETNRHK